MVGSWYAGAMMHRRDVLAAVAGLWAARLVSANPPSEPDVRDPGQPVAAPAFKISLAQWSFHRALSKGDLAHADFPARAQELGIDAVEYVNVFFRKKGDAAEVKELRRRCDDLGVSSLLIMCDGEGRLGDPDEAARRKTVDNHRAWLEAARELGCHSIRVNASSEGSFEEQQRLAADGLRRLCEAADPLGLNVIVENHGGWSSHGGWLAETIRRTGHTRAGTLPDFGNFRLGDGREYDRYQGVRELMPFARGVSAKSYDFNAQGEETTIDYAKMLAIVVEAGYRGYVGVEFEGETMSEREGVLATKTLLERVRATSKPSW